MSILVNAGKMVRIDRSWNAYLGRFRQGETDIYFTEEYVKLYENKDDKAECFIFCEGDKVFLFPYLKREISPFARGYYDIESTYGYGGPIANSGDHDFILRAAREFVETARENKIVAGLIRYHPLLGNHRLLAGVYEPIFDRHTIAMDLRPDRSSIWKEQVHSKHRNSVVKADKLGLVYRVDGSLEELSTFRELYRSTMERVKADRFYDFSDHYFKDLSKLGDHVFLALALLGGKAIAGALFLRYGAFGHYHLAGSLEEYKECNANNFLIYRTALHLKSAGVTTFHLGGGSDRRPDNRLFKFKRRFSPNEHSFYISKMVVDGEVYKQVCAAWESRYPEKRGTYKGYVLKYRY